MDVIFLKTTFLALFNDGKLAIVLLYKFLSYEVRLLCTTLVVTESDTWKKLGISIHICRWPEWWNIWMSVATVQLLNHYFSHFESDDTHLEVPLKSRNIQKMSESFS